MKNAKPENLCGEVTIQKSQIDKIVYALCASSQGANLTKLLSNILLILEAISINTEYEECVNRLLRQYYSRELYLQQLQELSRIAYGKIFSGRSHSYLEAREVCSNLLNELGFNGDSYVEQQKFYKFIHEGYLSIQYQPSPELIKRLCKYLDLEPSKYLPGIGTYGDYIAKRRKHLLSIIEDAPVTDHDFNYIYTVHEMQEALFTKLVQFIEKLFNDSWSKSIDADSICADTQELISELHELKKIEMEYSHNSLAKMSADYSFKTYKGSKI